MKNNKGFTLIELLAVVVILTIIVLIATFTIIPLLEKSKINAFGDDVISYAEGAETKYVSDGIDADSTFNDVEDVGVCYTLSSVKGEYVKSDKNYNGIVVLIPYSGTHKFKRYIYMASEKYVYNSTSTTSEALTDENQLEGIDKNKIVKGNQDDLTFKTCCAYYIYINPSYYC